ncbi:hypothetical protein FA95DRAFT_1560530 [Auriscalpium vulgare]|uniref:Uncharacterized protein n=1 Tax=Auriscalpium vulgare TaxID=40419 RepID=A0ACB8RPC3_9AGAM|nr:hypothetical protein FA95DRAFT_1560530 [Auriscalpium vulgare]
MLFPNDPYYELSAGAPVGTTLDPGFHTTEQRVCLTGWDQASAALREELPGIGPYNPKFIRWLAESRRREHKLPQRIRVKVLQPSAQQASYPDTMDIPSYPDSMNIDNIPSDGSASTPVECPMDIDEAIEPQGTDMTSVAEDSALSWDSSHRRAVTNPVKDHSSWAPAEHDPATGRNRLLRQRRVSIDAPQILPWNQRGMDNSKRARSEQLTLPNTL